MRFFKRIQKNATKIWKLWTNLILFLGKIIKFKNFQKLRSFLWKKSIKTFLQISKVKKLTVYLNFKYFFTNLPYCSDNWRLHTENTRGLQQNKLWSIYVILGRAAKKISKNILFRFWVKFSVFYNIFVAWNFFKII